MTLTETFCKLTGHPVPNVDAAGFHYGILSIHRLSDAMEAELVAHGVSPLEGELEATEQAVREGVEAVLLAAEDDLNDPLRSDTDEVQRKVAESFRLSLRDKALVPLPEELLDAFGAATLWDGGHSARGRLEEAAADLLEKLRETLSEDDYPLFYETPALALQWDDRNDLWVLRSPFYTYARECSPCAPNAGHLENTPGPLRTLCLPREWFPGGACPYPYWNLAGEQLYTPAAEP